MMRRALLLLFALVTLLGTGCKQAESLGGKPRPKRYARIVSLSPSTTEILAGNAVNLAGRTSACDYPENVRGVPVVASTKPDYEALARLKPDLIVYDAELYGEAEVRKLQGTGAKLLSYDPQSLEEYTRSLQEIGSLVALETGFSSYLDRVNVEVNSSKGDPPRPLPKVALILPDASGLHLIGGTKGLRAECLKIAGGQQVGPDSDRFEPLSPEFLVSQNPDVIILVGDRKTFEKDPRFVSLKARRNANVYAIQQDIVLRRGSRVDQLIKQFHKALSLSVQPLGTRAGSGSAEAN